MWAVNLFNSDWSNFCTWLTTLLFICFLRAVLTQIAISSAYCATCVFYNTFGRSCIRMVNKMCALSISVALSLSLSLYIIFIAVCCGEVLRGTVCVCTSWAPATGNISSWASVTLIKKKKKLGNSTFAAGNKHAHMDDMRECAYMHAHTHTRTHARTHTHTETLNLKH